MKKWTRTIVSIVGVAVMIVANTTLAQNTADWPSEHIIKLIVPWPPGGGGDTLMRMLSAPLSKALHQRIVIENKPGAAGNIGTGIGAKSLPDGYTLVYAYSGTVAINPNVYSELPFKESDFAPVIWLSSVPQVLVVHPSLPVKTVKQLIALAKAKPGKLKYSSAGMGSINDLAAKLFEMMTHTDMLHVPYSGGAPAALALLAGHVDLLFAEPATVVGQIKAGKARAIAVTSAKRAITFPKLPTIAESGVPGYAVTSWNGMLVPAGTPKDIIARLNIEYNKIIKAPDIRRKMLAKGYEPVGGPPEKFGAHIHAEIAKWAPVVKAANVKVQ